MTLQEHFEQEFGLPPLAVRWLLDLWEVIQTFDDYADGDQVERGRLDMTIFRTLVGMPANPWFQANAAVLLPVLENALLKWKASDSVEKLRESAQLPKAYVWRASYYDVVLSVVSVVHGVQSALVAAPSVMRLYGETLESYMQEFDHA